MAWCGTISTAATGGIANPVAASSTLLLPASAAAKQPHIPNRRICRQARPTPYGSDEYWTKMARRDNVPARSYYKLEEIDRKYNLFQIGGRVLDLGCAPGSWLVYASGRVGPRGTVTGFDLQEVDIKLPDNVVTRVADVSTLVNAALPEVDVLVSDMAPSTSGQKELDQCVSTDLAEIAMDIAETTVRQGGSFVAKIFESPETQQIREALQKKYAKVRLRRLKATRSQSMEMFLIGLEKKSSLNDSTAEERKGARTSTGPDVGSIPPHMKYELPPRHVRREEARGRVVADSSKPISYDFEGW